MRILSVVPILRGIAPQALSYYAKEAVAVGSFVRITIRSRKTIALVIESKDASTLKTELRKASFATKKIDSVVKHASLDERMMQALVAIADMHAAPLGAVLEHLLPSAMFESPDMFTAEKKKLGTKKDDNPRYPPQTLQMPRADRYASYRVMIREGLANNESTVVITPTIKEAEVLFEQLSRGIEERSFLITSTLTKKRFRDTWSKALVSKESIVLVGTPVCFSLVRDDIRSYIIEHESSPAYKIATRPFLDVRVAFETLARTYGKTLIFADSFLRIGTILNTIDHTYDESMRLRMHQEGAPVSIVDMRPENDTNATPTVISEVARGAIQTSADTNSLSFIYATRRGLAPFTICRDCGTILVCDRCDAPMVLHRQSPTRTNDERAGRLFACHRCGRTKDADTLCTVCGGWRLAMYGAGAETVEASVKREFPSLPFFSISSDSIKTHAEAEKVATAWQSSGNGILVGTARSLPYIIGAHIGTSVIASLDTLTSLPDIRMHERAFSLITSLREASSEHVVVQTRSPELPVLMYALRGDGLSFVRGEGERLKDFRYPPYFVCIKITRKGDKDAVRTDLTILKTLLPDYTITIYPAFISKVKGMFIAHALISVPSTSWPDRRVVETLRTLPPSYVVDVFPESIL